MEKSRDGQSHRNVSHPRTCHALVVSACRHRVGGSAEGEGEIHTGSHVRRTAKEWAPMLQILVSGSFSMFLILESVIAMVGAGELSKSHGG